MKPNPNNPSAKNRRPEGLQTRKSASRATASVGLGIGLAILMISALAMTGRHAWGGRTGDALARARRTGVIRIGYAIEAPYAFVTSTGRVTGQSPEIARIIAARLGIQHVEWRLTDFGNLIKGLNAGRFDVIAAGMFITPERQKQVAFSLPTFQVGPGLLVRKGNPLALHSYLDLAHNPQARIAVIGGSVEESELLRLGCPDKRLLRVPDALTGRAAVRAGRANALALSTPTIRWMALHPVAGATEMAKPFNALTGITSRLHAIGGFAFRKNDTELRRAWNTELARFIGSARHRRLVSAFGFTDAELPPGIHHFNITSSH